MLALPKADPDFWYEQIAAILDKAHALHRRRAGLSTWAYGKSQPRNLRQRFRLWVQDFVSQILATSPFIFRWVERWERARIKSRGRKEYGEFLRQYEPDAVVVSVPRFMYQSHLLSAAQTRGIPRFLFYHTNKDVVALSRLDHSFTAIGVWNDWMKESLLTQNPHLPSEAVHITGCAHFDCVGRYDWLLPESEFRQNMGVYEHEQLVLYTAAGPGVLPQEERFIDVVAQALKSLPDYASRLVVRLNPMDDSARIENYVREHHPRAVVLRPDWHYVRSQNLCYQRREDTKLLNNLLHYSSVCVNIPSTVTVECAIEGLPVINLGFDLPGPQPLPGSVRAFWDVDYYANIRTAGAASLATNSLELQEFLVCCLSNRNILSMAQKRLIELELNGIYPPNSGYHYLQILNQHIN
jgi:hypothetical protein